MKPELSQEQLKAWIKDAGWSGLYIQWGDPKEAKHGLFPAQTTTTVPVTDDQIQRFANIVFAAGVAQERERAAYLQETRSTARHGHDKYNDAAAIRAGSET